MDNREHKETIEHTDAKYSFGGAWMSNNRTSQQRKVERRVVLECINSHCGNSGAFPTMPDGEPEQCQFCYTEPRSIFSQANYENNKRTGNDRRQV